MKDKEKIITFLITKRKSFCIVIFLILLIISILLCIKKINILETDIYTLMNHTIYPVTLRTELGNIYIKPFVNISFQYYPYLGSDDWDKMTKDTITLYEEDFTHDLMLFGRKIRKTGEIEHIVIQYSSMTLRTSIQNINIGGEEYTIHYLFHILGQNTVHLQLYSAPPFYMDVTLDGEIIEINI